MVGPPGLEPGTCRFCYSLAFAKAWTISSPSGLPGGVPDANGVLHGEIAPIHLVSEPSPDASGAWLLIGILTRCEVSFPAIHPVFPSSITATGHKLLYESDALTN